jgi:hypothetical protein
MYRSRFATRHSFVSYHTFLNPQLLLKHLIENKETYTYHSTWHQVINLVFYFFQNSGFINIKWYSLSVTCDRLVVLFGYSGFLHQWKTDRYDITEIVLIVVLSTITLTLNSHQNYNSYNGFQGIVIFDYCHWLIVLCRM